MLALLVAQSATLYTVLSVRPLSVTFFFKPWQYLRLLVFSIGRLIAFFGGVAIYFKPDNWDRDKTQKIQITKISSYEDIDVINIYRSPRTAAADDADLVTRLANLINQASFSVLVGDLNICYNGNGN